MKTKYSIITLTVCSLIHFSVLGQQQSRMDSTSVIISGNSSDHFFGRYRDSTNFEVKINPDYFLLGTFYDYMGRFYSIDREKQVDRYYPYEESLAEYIVHFIETNYNVKVELQFEGNRFSEMFSKPIAEKLNSYYDEKGQLKKGIFDTEEEMYSFLTGVLLRDGENIFDNVFLISVYNSPKRNEIYELLKSLECNNIIYKNYRGNIPTVTKFYFEASPRIIKYFNLIRSENKTIRGEYENTIKKMLENADKKGLEKQDKELENSIKIIFKM